jgi:DNA-binding beta-propeller fold protein YncE
MDKIKSLALILALLVLFASAGTACAVEVVKTIPFIGLPVMVYDSYKGAVWVVPTYVAEYGVMGIPFYRSTNSVVAISDNDSSVLANITLGGSPVAYDSALHEVYLGHDSSVTVLSSVNDSVVATIESPTFHIGSIVYDSGKEEMFAITYNYTYNYTSGDINYTYGVAVISCIDKQVVATIPLGNYPPCPSPQGLTYDSGKGEIYVSYLNHGQNPGNYISVISDSNNSVIATIPLGNSTPSVGSGAYDSATGEIYLPSDNNNVLVISDETHMVIDTIHLQCPTTNPPSFVVAYDPVKSVIFAGAPYGKISIISDRTHSVVETIPVDSSYALVYDSGQNVMIAMSGKGLEFISDASLPDPPPTPTPTPTATPTPSLQNPVFLDLDWVQIAILVAMGIIAVAAVVAAFRFLRKDKAKKQTRQE